MDRPIAPINTNELSDVWQRYFRALEAYLDALEARVAALE